MAGPDLGKMIGPLPLGGWVAAVAGSLGIALYIKRRPARGDAQGGTEEVFTAPPVAAVFPLADRSGNGGASFTSPAPLAIIDNDAWVRAGILALVVAGYGALASQRALAGYIDGEPLNGDQEAMVEVALRTIGPTPRPVRMTQPVALPVEVPARGGGGGGGFVSAPAPFVPQAPTGPDYQQITRDLFTRYGVATAGRNETGDQRVARIARELEAGPAMGGRTAAQVEDSIRRIASGETK